MCIAGTAGVKADRLGLETLPINDTPSPVDERRPHVNRVLMQVASHVLQHAFDAPSQSESEIGEDAEVEQNVSHAAAHLSGTG